VSAVLRRSSAAALLLLALYPRPAEAVRFGLGVATELTPIVIDRVQTENGSSPVRLGFRPVLEVEVNHYLSFGAYAPFTVFRSGESEGSASSGAESVFGLTTSGRVPFFRETAPEEILAYVTGRGGFSTINGRAGPFLGAALGASATWLETGRGVFAEVGLSHADVTGVPVGTERVHLNRFFISFAVGLVFHLGGEDWLLGSKPLK
jgi:hypothetical protein